MLSVASLLNPAVKSEPRSTGSSSSPYSPYHTLPSAYTTPRFSSEVLPQKSKMTKDGAIFSKGKIKGQVNFPPFEKLDEGSLKAVRKFKVYPLGSITEFCRHIPYNSEKKSFLEKTGRESFEVFQYVFKAPGDDKEYTVMWDYNVGLVRITPFFKCCKYSKTTPAKMLNLNPGLKEITHSITGGALAAQGYWMPYTCAKAICATFCDHIAGALIPLFGPTFPSQCAPVGSPYYARMIISPSIIEAATAEAHSFRLQNSPAPNTTNHPPSSRTSGFPTPSPSTRTNDYESVSPRSISGEMPKLQIQLRKRPRVKRILPSGSTNEHYTYSSTPSPSSAAPSPYTSPSSALPSMHYRTPSGWSATNAAYNPRTPLTSYGFPPNPNAAGNPNPTFNANSPEARTPLLDHPMPFYRRQQTPAYIATPDVSPGASPWLSAIPRSAFEPVFELATSGTTGGQEAGDNYIPRTIPENTSGIGRVGLGLELPAPENEALRATPGLGYETIAETAPVSNEAASPHAMGEIEKKAALLLMKLSVQDCGTDTSLASISALESEAGIQGVKRKRALSL